MRLFMSLVVCLMLAAGTARADIAPSPAPHHQVVLAADHEGAEEAVGAEHAGAEHEAGEHEARIESPVRLALSLLNFAVLAFILIKFGGPAVKKGLAARHVQLKTDISQAADAKAAAEARYQAQEARLAGLEQEIAALRAKLRGEAEAEKGRLLVAAQERAARVREETRFVLEQQTKEAAQIIRREAAEAAVRVAEEILRRQVGGADQQRFLDGFVNDVSSRGGQA